MLDIPSYFKTHVVSRILFMDAILLSFYNIAISNVALATLPRGLCFGWDLRFLLPLIRLAAAKDFEGNFSLQYCIFAWTYHMHCTSILPFELLHASVTAISTITSIPQTSGLYSTAPGYDGNYILNALFRVFHICNTSSLYLIFVPSCILCYVSHAGQWKSFHPQCMLLL